MWVLFGMFLCPVSVFFCPSVFFFPSFLFIDQSETWLFSLQLCLEGHHPRVASSLLMLRLVFCRYYLMKLPVEDM